MQRLRDGRIIRFTARLAPLSAILLGAVLFLAAIGKATAPTDALGSLAFVFGESASPPLLGLLVFVEIVLGALLLACVRLDMTLLIAAVLFGMFLLWIGYLALAEAPVGCGCGFHVPLLSAIASQEDRALSAARSGGLFIIAVIGSVGAASRPQNRLRTQCEADRSRSHEEL